MAAGNFVAYYRVSTARQGQSGLGLEAQRSAVAEYLDGGRWRLVGAYTEIETGTRSDRPQLTAALAACRLHSATLVVAKLDRLARNAHFLLGLKEAGVEFVACDMPSANRLTVGIMAMVAEEEARMISARTKAALQAARARGVKLGNPGNLKNRAAGSRAGNKAKANASQRRANDLLSTIQQIRSAGAASLRSIAAALNERAIPSPRGRAWQATTVARLLARLP